MSNKPFDSITEKIGKMLALFMWIMAGLMFLNTALGQRSQPENQISPWFYAVLLMMLLAGVVFWLVAGMNKGKKAEEAKPE